MTQAPKAKAPSQPMRLRDRAQASRVAADRALRTEQRPESPTLAPACGVSRIGDRLTQAYREYWALDELPSSDKGIEARLRMKALEDLHAELAEAISYGRAGSGGGMLAQLSVAYDALAAIKDGSTEMIRERAYERTERCLLSVAAAVSVLTGVDRMGFGAAELMPARLDTLSVLAPEVA